MQNQTASFFKQLMSKNKSFTPYFLILLAASLLTLFTEMAFFNKSTNLKSQKTVDKEKRLLSADTFIPSGFVLVPIEISNHEALNSLIGSHGIVDLFLPPSRSFAKPRRVASHIKILRAPLDPQKFAVLAKESESERLVTQDSPLFAVVKNPKHESTVKVVEKRKMKRRIYFDEES